MNKRHPSELLKLDFEQIVHETEKAAFVQFKRHAVWFPKKAIYNWSDAKKTYLINVTWAFLTKNSLEFLEAYEVTINYQVPGSKEVIIKTKGNSVTKPTVLNPLDTPKRKIDF